MFRYKKGNVMQEKIKVGLDIENKKLNNQINEIFKKYIPEVEIDQNFYNCHLILTDNEQKYTMINGNNFIVSFPQFTLNKSTIIIKISEYEENLPYDSALPIIFIDDKRIQQTIFDLKNMLKLCCNIIRQRKYGNISELSEKIKELDTKLIITSKQVEEALEEMIIRLSLAVEARDHFSGDHVKRVANYCKIIAEYLGLEKEFIERIYLASPLHDVGKVGIPDNILLKPAKLTPEEFEIMKKHTLIGAQILANSKHEVIKMAENIALTHHEKYNGKGYPLGLKGENIPIEGRIVAIADVFDALTSRRPYKEPWPIEDAVREIKKESKEHFCPEVVNAFLKNLKKIIEIKHTYF